MNMTQPDDDNDDPKWVWPHPADLGTVAIAAVFLIGMIGTIIWMFSSAEPVRDLFGHKQEAAQTDNGEVTIDLQQKK
jgi:hypothetical protein